MLATVGFLFQQVHHPLLPDEANPLKAVAALGLGPQLQILLAIGCIELATWDGTFSGKRRCRHSLCSSLCMRLHIRMAVLATSDSIL